MSNAYLKKLVEFGSVDMRLHCQRPGDVDDKGKLVYLTEQHHKDECNVNHIIRKYESTGLVTHIANFEGRYGDLQGVDFKNAMDLVTRASSDFADLPSNIRKRFKNNPQELLAFMEDPENRKEGIKLGLIRADVLETMDGFGEHVKADDYGKKADETKKEVEELKTELKKSESE